MIWEKSPAHWEQECLEKCSFSQAGREAHDFIERELTQTLLTPLAKSPHNSGVKVHILPFPPHTLISQQSEMSFLLSMERLIELSTGPKELIKAIFHLGEKSMQSTEVQLSRAASLCSIRVLLACLLPPHINFLCVVFCQLSMPALMFVKDFLACVVLMIHFYQVSLCQWMWRAMAVCQRFMLGMRDDSWGAPTWSWP